MTQPWKTLLTLPLCLGLLPTLGNAQIIPDRTLPQNTLITTPQTNLWLIEGGTTQGSNLFHSFDQFSLPTNTQVFFNNTPNISNIFSRITGSNPSTIDGLIRANGAANLFLLNPNGILFGPNASLNIGGSFLATTANSFTFSNGTEFSATNPQAPPLLTVSVPVSLTLGTNPGSIIVQGPGHNLTPDPQTGAVISQPAPSLSVAPSQTLTLAGGPITLTGGNLRVTQGKIVLGSFGPNAQVGLTPTLDLNAQNPFNFQDIQLLGKASVDVSGPGGGNIAIQGRQVTVGGGSAIVSITEGRNPSGTIAVNGSESINLLGASPERIPSAILSETINLGSGGDIILNTHQLIVRDGAQISTATFSPGKGGQLTVNASSLVEVSGGIPEFPSGLYAPTLGFGPGGNLVINTNRLIVQNRAEVASETVGIGREPAGNIAINAREVTIQGGSQIRADTFGRGNAGNVGIQAIDGIRAIGGSQDQPTGIFSQVNRPPGENIDRLPPSGNGGNINIETSWLSLENGAQISASTAREGRGGTLQIQAAEGIHISGAAPTRDGLRPSAIAASSVGPGTAGNITLNTRDLLIAQGGQITASTRDRGEGGTLRVTASESVTLRGVAPDGRPTRMTVRTEGPGNAGDLIVGTQRLTVENGAEINVNAILPNEQGRIISGAQLGGAGDILITASQVEFNRGQITANTTSGTQGNIFLNSQDIRLREGSQMVTNAFGAATGGNISINTDLLTALENSDISANAEQNFGGRVIITAQGIFGTQFRDGLTDQSDITATSALGPQFRGVVEINTPEVDPSQSLIDLPQGIQRPNQIEQICRPELDSGTRRLTQTGRGLPPTPAQLIDPPGLSLGDRHSVEVDFITPIPTSTQGNSWVNSDRLRLSPPTAKVISATGWVINAQGEVFLTAASRNITPHPPISPDAECPPEN